MAPPVLVLHGIWNSPFWVWPLARRLRRAGIDARAWGYPSVLGGPEAALPALAAEVRRLGCRGLVGYSLGGLLALELVRREPALGIGRVVCLGSPLAGSGTARWLAAHRLGCVLGRSRTLLCDGLPPVGEGGFPARVGLVAGCRPLGIGRLLGAQGRRSDGTVGLREMRWPGFDDRCLVAASHTGLPWHRPAQDQVAAFLLRGRFDRRSGRRPPMG